jgi:predicted nucleic acid-binding protein
VPKPSSEGFGMPDTFYWDACVFLSAVNGDPARLPHIEAMLDAASKGDLVVLTSTLSKVEVAFGATEQQARALDPEVEAKIDELWDSGSPVKLVEFHELLASDARGLIRKAVAKGWSLRPADAVHLATAMRYRAGKFHTYDDRLQKFTGDIGIAIEEPVAPQPQMSLPPGQGTTP